MYLGSEVFQDGGEINRSAGADTIGVLSGFEKASNTADGKLKTGLMRSGHRIR